MNEQENISWEKEFDEQFDTDFRGGIGVVKGDKLCCRGDFCSGHEEDTKKIKSFIKSLLSRQASEIRENTHKLPTYEIDYGHERKNAILVEEITSILDSYINK